MASLLYAHRRTIAHRVFLCWPGGAQTPAQGIAKLPLPKKTLQTNLSRSASNHCLQRVALEPAPSPRRRGLRRRAGPDDGGRKQTHTAIAICPGGAAGHTADGEGRGRRQTRKRLPGLWGAAVVNGGTQTQRLPRQALLWPGAGLLFHFPTQRV